LRVFQYGLLYHSTFIGRAGAKHKGRISRFLANKCSIAARIDCFSGASRPLDRRFGWRGLDAHRRFARGVVADPPSLVIQPLDVPTNKFGEALRAQVEERLAFYESGTAVSKNSDAIKKALEAIAMDEDADDNEDAEMTEAEASEAVAQIEADEKKRSKEKKSKKGGEGELPVLAEVKALVGDTIETVVKAEKKDKKKKRKVRRARRRSRLCGRSQH
jgi:nucleolar protein 56